MDLHSIWNVITHVWQALISCWLVKVVGAFLLAMIYHKQAILFYGFTLLVFVDCFTRWMAISHNYLVAKDEEPTVIKCIVGIKAARAEGLISSTVMKHRFLGKIFIYFICVLTAVVTDTMLNNLGQTAWAVTTVIGYLTMTELLSIIENLNAAGIECLDGLLNIIKKKRG